MNNPRVLLAVSKYPGDVGRGEGRLNFPYGPTRAHARKSLFAVHAQGSHGVKPYPCRNHDAVTGPDHSRDGEKRVMLEAKTRDELRAICKAQNVTGYGKMNKAQLIEAALA